MPELLVDQGLADTFLETRLQRERLEEACQAAGIPLTRRRHPGDDHRYWLSSASLTTICAGTRCGSHRRSNLRFHASIASKAKLASQCSPA